MPWLWFLYAWLRPPGRLETESGYSVNPYSVSMVHFAKCHGVLSESLPALICFFVFAPSG